MASNFYFLSIFQVFTTFSIKKAIVETTVWYTHFLCKVKLKDPENFVAF